MNLYLDLRKAVQVPSTATDTIPERRAVRGYEESFNRRSSGVNEDPSNSSPKGDDEDSVDDDLEADRKRDAEIAQERGIISKPDTQKSEAADMLKSFAQSLHAQTMAAMPNDAEIEYLTTQCYSPKVDEKGNGIMFSREDVIKGYARIEGSERSRFNAWLHERFQKSLGKLAL